MMSSYASLAQFEKKYELEYRAPRTQVVCRVPQCNIILVSESELY